MLKKIFRTSSLIQTFAQIGLNPNTRGMNRPALSKEEKAAKDLLCEYLKDLGATITIDNGGNVIGRIDGTDSSLPSIAIGSHLDTVPEGGKYDGALGVLAGLSVLAKIVSSGEKLKSPVELICFMGEESSRFGMGLMGSRIYNGKVDVSKLKTTKDKNGTSIYEALKDNGFDIDNYKNTQNHKCYLELHIEQGKVLEQQNLDIGIVTHIGSAMRVKLNLKGEADHTATTPHVYRRDALLTASRIVQAVREISLSFKDEYMQATVSNVVINNSAWNIVPNDLELHIDIRDYITARKQEFVAKLKEKIDVFCKEDQISYQWNEVSDSNPREVDAALADKLEEATKKLGFSYRRIISGASHDAQLMNCPIGMLFIPSKNGRSHTPEEFSADEFMEKATEVLYETVVGLAR